MDTSGVPTGSVEMPTAKSDEYIPLLVIMADQIFGAGGVAEMKQDVLVADWPEIGTGAVVSRNAFHIIFYKRVQMDCRDTCIGD